MESEKDAVKRAIAHEARFRDEKQQIVESLGGSRAELVTPSTTVRVKRKLKNNPPSTSSSLLSHGSARSFQAAEHPEEAPTSRDDLPRALDHSEEQNDYNTEEHGRGGTRFKKNKRYIVAVIILVIAIGGIVGVSVAFFTRAQASSPSTTEGGTASTADGMCRLDREAIAKCENGVLAIPDCAAEAYQNLTDTYSDVLLAGASFQGCTAIHQGLVALAVSQTNHGEDIIDPTMFFALSTLYFALKGTQWKIDTNWLKGSSPCTGFWYGIECSPDGSLATLSLERNRLGGFLPTEIALLSDLKGLDIGFNEEVSGSLPSEIGILTALTKFRVTGASLTGSIPSEVGNMIQLEEVEMESNLFTGTLPSELGNLVQLRKLVLAFLSGITGTIPSDLIALTRLEQVKLILHAVDPEPLPEVITVATNLEVLYISETQFTGSLPSIAHLSHLQELSLQYLEMTGIIPTEIGHLSGLTLLSLEDSNLQGTIPSEFGLLTALSWLVIRRESRVIGSLPSELGSLTALEHLDVRDTGGLSGRIPREVCALNLPTDMFLYNQPWFLDSCSI